MPPGQDKKAVAVLISGRGSNMLSLARAAAGPDYPARICLVASDSPAAAGLSKAKKLGLATACIDRARYDKRSNFEAALDERIRESGAELICLAGFMRLLSAAFVTRWHNRILNIHPSLLPAFKGLDTHQRALDAGVRLAGCTVHIVRPAMDDGPIIAQGAVGVLPGDTAESLADRVLAVEHRLYPAALAQMAAGMVSFEGDRCVIADPPWNKDFFANPNYD